MASSTTTATASDRSSIWADSIVFPYVLEDSNIELYCLNLIHSGKNNNEKLNILIQQRQDLSTAIDSLIDDISKGNKYMKVYKQMKMYNDDELNPVLRKIK